MKEKLKKYDLDTLIKGLIAGGIISLVALGLVLVAHYRQDMLLLVMTSLLSVLGLVAGYYFARNS